MNGETVVLKTPLRVEGFVFEPASFDRMMIAAEAQFTFSVLTGRYGGRQIPLACSAAGILTVADAASLAMLTTIHGDVDSVESSLASMLIALGSLGTIEGNILTNLMSMLAILNDTYEAATHSFRTNEVP